MQDPSVPVMLGASNDEDTNAQGHIEDTDGMGDHSSVQQQGMGILADQSLYFDKGSGKSWLPNFVPCVM